MRQRSIVILMIFFVLFVGPISVLNRQTPIYASAASHTNLINQNNEVAQAVVQAPPDICLQSDNNDLILQLNSVTGDYTFRNCDSDFTLTGTGAVTTRGPELILQHFGTDHKVLARINTSINKGSATIQVVSQSRVFSIVDKDTENNTRSE